MSSRSRVKGANVQRSVCVSKENHKTQRGRQARDIVRGGGGDAGGKDYDDVAKVGMADHDNFQPGDRTHKDKAQVGPPF
jgi:hypothetical protein